jgi:hypothetical protein
MSDQVPGELAAYSLAWAVGESHPLQGGSNEERAG